jgi:hypothetical protein
VGCDDLARGHIRREAPPPPRSPCDRRAQRSARGFPSVARAKRRRGVAVLAPVGHEKMIMRVRLRARARARSRGRGGACLPAVMPSGGSVAACACGGACCRGGGQGYVLCFDAQLHPGKQTAGHDADHNGQWRGHHGARVRSGRFHWRKFLSLARSLALSVARPLALNPVILFRNSGPLTLPLRSPAHHTHSYTRTLTHTTTHKQAHLGVRLKKDGYKVIGADWKRQEYFEEKEFCDEFHEVGVGAWVYAGVGRA